MEGIQIIRHATVEMFSFGAQYQKLTRAGIMVCWFRTIHQKLTADTLHLKGLTITDQPEDKNQ